MRQVPRFNTYSSMALTFDVSRTQHESLDRGTRDTVIMASMLLGLSELTLKNIDEWELRVRSYQKMFGPLMVERTEHGVLDVKLTREHLEPMVGMTTNAGTETRAKWAKRMVESLMREEAHKMGREKREK